MRTVSYGRPWREEIAALWPRLASPKYPVPKVPPTLNLVEHGQVGDQRQSELARQQPIWRVSAQIGRGFFFSHIIEFLFKFCYFLLNFGDLVGGHPLVPECTELQTASIHGQHASSEYAEAWLDAYSHPWRCLIKADGWKFFSQLDVSKCGFSVMRVGKRVRRRRGEFNAPELRQRYMLQRKSSV